MFHYIRKTGLCFTLAVSFSLPALAQNSQQLRNTAQTHITQIAQQLQAGKLQGIESKLEAAEQAYKSFQTSKDVKSVGENKWRVEKSLEQDLVLVYLQAAHQFHKNGDHERSLKLLEKSHRFTSYLPATYYMEALNLLKQGKTWEATEKLYESKRYNRFPSTRKLENPNEPSDVLWVNPETLEKEIDQILADLGKDADYPITLNFSNGQHRHHVLVPGIGINLANAEQELLNLYLESSRLADITNHLGKAMDIQEEPDRKQVLRRFNYPGFSVRVTPENTVERVEVMRPGYSIRIKDKYYSIGEDVGALMQVLGQEYKEETPRQGLKQIISYGDHGLSVGVDHDNKIAMLSVWTME